MTQQDIKSVKLQVPVDDWLELLDREYLSDYVLSGGSVVKVITGSDESLEQALDAYQVLSGHYGYFFANLNAAELISDGTRPDGKKPDLHRIDRFFFEATSDVDWRAWAAAEARRFLTNNGIHVGERALNDLEGIAADNGRDVTDLLNQYQRGFATPLIRDHSMAIEFRTALTALSRAQLVPESMTPTTEEVLLGWFSGKTMPGAAAALKRINIFSRIDRSTSRNILASFCRWLPRTGRSGLCIVLDFRPYEHKPKTRKQMRDAAQKRLAVAITNRASHEELSAILAEGEAELPLSYTQAAYDQMLQLLRRFIDEIDWFERFCLVVLTSEQFCQKEKSPDQERHFSDYNALQTRIGLEVHDANHANPAAALVHLTGSEVGI